MVQTVKGGEIKWQKPNAAQRALVKNRAQKPLRLRATKGQSQNR